MFHKFKYYLLDKDGRSYFLDNNGNVQTSAVPTPLKQTPDGWQDVNIGYERDLVKLGVVRSFTLPLAFVRDASKILKWVVYTKNIEEKIYLLIQKLSNDVDLTAQTFSLKYEYLYRGELDLSSFVDQDIKTQLSISEGGTYKSVKANEANNYEIDLDNDSDTVLIEDDGIKLFDTANFVVTEIQLRNPSGSFGAHYVPASMVSRDGSAAGFAGLSNFGDPYSEPPDINLAHFTTSQVITGMRISGSIKFKSTSVSGFSAERHTVCFNSNLRPGSLSNTPGIAYLNPNGKPGEALGIDNIVSFDFDATFDAGKDEYFSIYFYTKNAGAGFNGVDFLETSFKVEFGSQYKTTYTKGQKLPTVAKRITAKVTGDESNIDPAFLELHDNLILRSGDNIRGIRGGKIKTSLNDLTEFIRVVLAAGQGIEGNKIVFNPYSYFLNPSDPIYLGEVSGNKTSFAKDIISNSLKVGYPIQQIDNVNGKYSFNNTNVYSSPISSVTKEYNSVSKYIADAFYQEILRINLEGKTTTDDKGDNTVFVLNAEKKTKVFNTTITADIDSDGNFFSINLPDDTGFFQTTFNVSATSLNNGLFTVKNIITTLTGFKVYVYETTVTETSPATISIEYYSPKRITYTAISGIPDPITIYNIEELTPRRILNKQAELINSLFYGFAGQKIKWETTDKNADLITNLSGVIIKEKADYVIGSNILFKPFYFEFDTTVPNDLVETLESNLNRCFSFSWYGDLYKGFLVKAGVSSNDNKSQTFKLLACPDTDLTKLIF